MRTITEPSRDVEARKQLYAALDAATRGRPSLAASVARGLLGEAQRDPVVWIVAGVALYVARDYEASMRAFDGAVRCGGGGRALALKRDRALRLGWGDVAREAREAASAFELVREPASSAAPAPHARDREDLLEAMRFLRGLVRTTPEPEDVPPHAPLLTGAQIDAFIARGYVHVPDALPRSLLETWRTTTCARVDRMRRDAGAGPFVADAPITWPSDVLVVPNETEVVAREHAPRLWSAVCDLFGGAARVRTRTISDYFVLRFPSAPSRAANGDGFAWHVDDPPNALDVRALRTGVVGLALFSDVAPGGGATWILPESVSLVCRALAEPATPRPLDAGFATSVASRCAERVECVGRAGDVFLVHPLMVHSGSVNRTRTIRWLSNWMFYPATPLDAAREQGASPVERAMRAALNVR